MKNKEILYLITLFLSFVLLSQLVNFVNQKNILNSPDEVSNYIIMKEYAINGVMYLSDIPYIELDNNNLLHQRGFLTWNNKVVPFNYFGFPFFYGPFYNFLGENLKYILVGIDVLILLFILYSLYYIFYNEKMKLYSTSLFILLTPIIFYLNLFYFNITGNILFFLLFFLYLIKFDKTGDKKNLYLSALFASIAIFFRYESIIFVFLVFIISILNNIKFYKNLNNKIITLFKLFLIFTLSFVIPLLILNYKTYGNPLIYGYSLFNKLYFPNERTGSIFVSIKNILFPSRVFSLTTFFNNINSVVLIFSYLFFAILIFGLLSKHSNKIISYLFLILYFLVYNGMNPDTYLSGSGILTLAFSVLRYWMLIFPFVLMPVIYYFNQKNLNKILKVSLISFLLINSILLITVNSKNSSVIYYKNYFLQVQKNKEILSNLTNSSDYLITSVNGKLYYDQINIISWWGGPTQSQSDLFFNATHIANISKLLISKNHSVYYLADKYNSKYVSYLENQNLTFSEIPQFKGLYKITINQ